MDNYNSKLREYRQTLQMVAGCGDRAQGYIDEAYQELSNAWLALTAQEKNDNPLPKKEICRNDGTGGISTGTFMMGRNRARHIP